MDSDMTGYVAREAEKALQIALSRAPVVALLGPRQCGKTTLAKRLLASSGGLYLDLQDRSHRARLQQPELFMDRYRGQLICLDEIQRLPEFFSFLRSEVDRDRRPGRFFILGSASPTLP